MNNVKVVCLPAMSFGKTEVELNLIKSMVDLDKISLRNLDKIREDFIGYYFQKPSEYYRTHGLFEFHKELIEHGHNDIYTH